MTKKWTPDWFDIRNYDAVATMNLAQWANALNFRYWLTSSRSEVQFIMSELFPTDEDKILALASASQAPHKGWPFECDEPLPEEQERQSVSSVSIDLLGAYWGQITSKGDGAKFKKALEIGRTPKQNDLAEKYSQLANTTIDEYFLSELKKQQLSDDLSVSSHFERTGGFTLAQIDFGATDEQLISDFKKWLANIRSLTKSENVSQRFTPAEMEAWHTNKLLPYIDLTIWMKITGAKITQQQLGLVLFPDNFEIILSDRIRKTTKKDADNLLKISTIFAICQQAGVPCL